MRWKSLLTAAVSVGVIAGAVGCSAPLPASTAVPSSTFPHTGDGVLRIGSIFPTTGASTFIGAAQVAGVELAVREINKDGGVNGAPVQVFHDNSGDATTKTAEASFADLVSKKVDVVIGPSSTALVERLLPPALAAHVPLITPAATFPFPVSFDQSGYIFRTIPTYADQGIALAKVLTAHGPTSVELVYLDNDLGSALASSLKAALSAHSGSSFATAKFDAKTTDFSKLVAGIVGAKPDAVVLATPGDAVAQTKSLISALSSAKFGGSKLWLTSQNLADYSQALPSGLLNGVNGILEGAHPDTAFISRLRQVDSGLGNYLYAAEAYDATVLAALAAVVAKDDGGPAIARTLQSVSVGGIKCSSFAECVGALKTQSDIDYDGVSGAVNFTDTGDVSSGSFGIYRYGAGNTYTYVSTVISN